MLFRANAFSSPAPITFHDQAQTAQLLTKNSKRNAPLSARVKEILARRHDEAGKPDMGFVFAREDDSSIPYCSIDTQHDRTIAKLAFRFRIYDCRHAFGTVGESGADAYTICKLMGHSNILVSQRYVDPPPERLEMALAGLDAYNQERAKVAREKAKKRGNRTTPNPRSYGPISYSSPRQLAKSSGFYAGPFAS